MALDGKKVALRQVEYDDLPLLCQWRNDPGIRSRTREYRLLTMADQEAWWESLQAQRFPTALMFVVEAHASRANGHRVQPVGVVGLCYVNWKDRNAEMSFYIGDTSVRRQGLCSDALSVLLRYGFGEMGMHRIWAEAFEYNDASVTLMERLGLRVEGKLRSVKWYDGRWHDSTVMSILDEEWRERNAAV